MDDAFWRLEPRDALLLEPDPADGEVEGRRGHDERADALTEAGVRFADDGGLSHRGWASRIPSTSAAAMFSPPRMMTSFMRPAIVSQSSASTVARSPVRNQPRRIAPRVWSGSA